MRAHKGPAKGIQWLWIDDGLACIQCPCGEEHIVDSDETWICGCGKVYLFEQINRVWEEEQEELSDNG